LGQALEEGFLRERRTTMSLRILAAVLSIAIAPLAYAVIGGGDISFPMKDGKKVVFSHDSHVAAHWLACTDCHASLFTTRGAHKPVTMAQMAQGQSCGACHNGKWAFSVKENCKLCHE
jgi:c(7)-type cytochrome triheme protein